MNDSYTTHCCACDGAFQHASLGCTFALFACGLLFKAEGVDSTSIVCQALSVFVIALFICFALFSVVVRAPPVVFPVSSHGYVSYPASMASSCA